MAFFTIIFGVRHLDPTEKYSGIMVALAFESIFKLFALLIAGFWVCYLMNPCIFSIFKLTANLELQPNIQQLSAQISLVLFY